MRLFLASESPRRRELLKRLVTEFEVESADVCELDGLSGLSAERVVLHNAAQKAHYVSVRHPSDWVLGADTVVVLDGQIYGKPADLTEARDFLQRFSGREHQVITGVSLQNQSVGTTIEFVAESRVRFRNLSTGIIEEYLSQVPVLDKAGAYGMQDHGDLLVEAISGELENIIGLPVQALQEHFQQAGIDKLLPMAALREQQ